MELIEARRAGKGVKVRKRDESLAIKAERQWEMRLGRLFASEWDGVKLFEESEL